MRCPFCKTSRDRVIDSRTSQDGASVRRRRQCLSCRRRFTTYERAELAPRLVVKSDSELVVKQVRGEYRVKQEHLKPLHARAAALMREIPEARIEHVPRSANAHADALANEAMDCRSTVGDAPAPGAPFGQGTLFD